MKKFAMIATLALAAIATAQTPAPSLTGNWNIHATIAGNESDSVCAFTQTGNDLAGTCTPAEQAPMKFTGKVDGEKVTFSAAGDYNGTPLTMKYVGKLTAGKMSGTVTVDPFGVEGEFTGTPVKKAE